MSDFCSVKEIYSIWLTAMRIVRKNPHYELPDEFVKSFEDEVIKNNLTTYPSNRVRNLVHGAQMEKNNEIIISISKWGKLLKNSANLDEERKKDSKELVTKYEPRRKRRYVLISEPDEGPIPYGMVNAPPTGGIAKSDLG
jgi:hypothetical protein